MDPLSITASVITVLAATGKVGEGLEKLWALKGAPHELLALVHRALDNRSASRFGSYK